MTQAVAPYGRTTAPGAPPRGLRPVTAGEGNKHRIDVGTSTARAALRPSPIVVIGTSGVVSGNIRNMDRLESMFYSGAFPTRTDVFVPEIPASRGGDTATAQPNRAAGCGPEQLGSAGHTAAVPALYHVSGFEYI